MTTKVTIELTEEQAYVIMDALEFMCRIEMGQFNEIPYRINQNTYDEALKHPKFDMRKAEEILREAKMVMFPQLQNMPGAYIGIAATNERSKVSWDLYQQIRHDLSWHRNPEGGMTVNFDQPFVLSKQPLPKVTIMEDQVCQTKKQKRSSTH